MTGNALVALVRGQLKAAHDVLEGTMMGVTTEMAAWQPPGTANGIGPIYGHVAVAEDALLNGMGRGIAPLMAGSWAGKTGLSELPPADGKWHDWSLRVNIDMTALRAYAQGVFTASDEYLATLQDSDLDVERDFSAMGFGTRPIGWLFSILIANVQWHTGEISCLKGLQGAQGYPF
jgi:hypothetical protein